MVEIGDVVTYVDENRQHHNALVQHVHTQDLINIIILSADPSKEDTYGRQIEHKTSLPRRTEATVPYGFHFFEK